MNFKEISTKSLGPDRKQYLGASPGNYYSDMEHTDGLSVRHQTKCYTNAYSYSEEHWRKTRKALDNYYHYQVHIHWR